jgi:hypothetical protein
MLWKTLVSGLLTTSRQREERMPPSRRLARFGFCCCLLALVAPPFPSTGEVDGLRAQASLVGATSSSAPPSPPSAVAPGHSSRPEPPSLPDRREDVALNSVPLDALCPQWWTLARDLGWGERDIASMDVVMYRESRCLPEVWNREDPNGGSRGLMQINGSWTRWLRDRGVLQTATDLLDPAVNLRAALLIYEYGLARHDFGWGPWGFRTRTPYPAE